MSIHDRGFASMNKDKQKQIAALGGKAAHKLGVAHEWNPETARLAGQKGGKRTQERRALKAVAF